MKGKKILKITGISVLILLLILVVTPFLFKGKIENMLKKAINEQVNAKFDFSEVDLSLIRSFPKASLRISDLSLINNAPFEGDTLVAAKEIYLTLSIAQLFKSEGMAIDAFKIDHAYINIKIDSLEHANYDIAKDSKASNTNEAKSNSSSFNFELSEYEITNSRINYLDDSAKMYLRLDDFQHSGSGNLSAANSLLKTKTQSLVSFEFGGTNYFKNAKVTLDADLGIDMESQKYTFKDNKALINQLPLVFDGFVQLTDEGQNIDLSFKTPSSSFKNFLAIIPEEYAKNIENVETQGDFVVQGIIKGVSDDTHIPHLDIRIASEKAAFKYPDLPKKVEDIYIKMDIKNETGLVEDTYIKLDTLCFRIDQDVFRANARFSNLAENMVVKTHIDGKIDLSKVSQA
ncbi:MAG: AsmA family protein, partial [Flavobacteriaceae bacterium]|nr:AsmA family protein [Flavobacteriaceae bacterium]